jgi:hypothetical protein
LNNKLILFWSYADVEKSGLDVIFSVFWSVIWRESRQYRGNLSPISSNFHPRYFRIYSMSIISFSIDEAHFGSVGTHLFAYNKFTPSFLRGQFSAKFRTRLLSRCILHFRRRQSFTWASSILQAPNPFTISATKQGSASRPCDITQGVQVTP